ncbi:MAG: hypothetical protein KF915_05905 [Polyangiaceae bacterium]|nr:hypothetical protein [Polyangiaceae bacterium]
MVTASTSAWAEEPRRQPLPASHYVQYGVGMTTEALAHGGDVCPPSSRTPCILGSGLGLAIRTGYRARGPWYVGGAYEFSRQDPANLMRLAILQQLRAETRYYTAPLARLSPYLTGGLGMALYGNEFGSDTGGVTTFVGAGLELQLNRTTVVGGSLVYRPLLLRGWTDSASQRRADRYLGFGLTHLVGLELTLELRGPLGRW